MRKKTPVVAFAIAMTAPQLAASEPGAGALDELHDALAGGTPKLDLRYRYEDVDSSPGRQGNASTLRTVLSWKTGSYENFSSFLEFEDTLYVLDELSPSTAPGGIPDPSGGSVNQWYIQYEGVDNLDVRVGRREITLDNERFIGDYDWRQNHQALDGVSFQYTGVENLVATYVYVDSVSDWLGNDISQDGTHLLHARYDVSDAGSVSGYYYRIESNGSPAGRLASTDTMGVRYDGDVEMSDTDFDYSLEWATQSDRGNNPTSYTNQYLNFETAVTVSDIKVGVQFERLGGSRNYGNALQPFGRGEFVTPLADFHEHNGLADVFALGAAGVGRGGTITGAGLQDLNVNVSGEVSDVEWLVAYHIFDSDAKYATPVNPGRDELGHEIDLQATYQLNDHTQFGLLLARFTGYNAYPDVAKFMAWMSYTIL